MPPDRGAGRGAVPGPARRPHPARRPGGGAGPAGSTRPRSPARACRSRKAPGDEVFAGTINGDGALTVESTKPASDTTLARIIRMVGEAQSRRAPSEQWVEKFARYYTPAVMALALAVLLVPPLFFGGSWARLVLPVARPARHRLPVRARHLDAGEHRGRAGRRGAERRAHQGRRVRRGPGPAEGRRDRQDRDAHRGQAGRRRGRAAERPHRGRAAGAGRRPGGPEHPPARPRHRRVREGAGRRPSRRPRTSGSSPGRGRAGASAGPTTGSGRTATWRSAARRRPRSTSGSRRWPEAGRTVVVVGNDRHVCGFIALADAVRPEAKQAVADLRAAGIEHVVMLTGDNQGTAEAIARETGRGRGPRRTAAGGQGDEGRGTGRQVRDGGDGRRRRERRPGDGPGDARDRDGGDRDATRRSRRPTSPSCRTTCRSSRG